MKKKTLSNHQRVTRTRVILAIIIAATIPCYCSGLIILDNYPKQQRTETPTASVEPTATFPTIQLTVEDSSTPTETFTITASPTETKKPTSTYTPFMSPTITLSPTSSFTPTFTIVPSSTMTEIPPDTATPTNTTVPVSTATNTDTVVNPTEEETP